MFSIAKAMSALPVGFAYSTYSGLTVVGVLVFAMIKYNQIPNLYAIIGIILIDLNALNPFARYMGSRLPLYLKEELAALIEDR